MRFNLLPLTGHLLQEVLMSSEMAKRWAVREAEEEAAREFGQPLLGNQLLKQQGLTGVPSPALAPLWHQEENRVFAGSRVANLVLEELWKEV